jgi:hypothetical protein
MIVFRKHFGTQPAPVLQPPLAINQ